MSTPTVDEILGAVAYSGLKWTTPTITFSIPRDGSAWPGYGADSFPFSADYSVFSAQQAANFRLAEQTWARLIAVPVVETDDIANTGQIRAAFSDTGVYGALGTYPPGIFQLPPYEFTGDIWIGSHFYKTATFSPTLGSEEGYVFQTLVHELGHALGLKHPHEGDHTLPLPWANQRYTIMAYDGLHDSETFTFVVDPTSSDGMSRQINIVPVNTPMVYDILAVQSLYGANPTTNAGDTVYTWSESKPFIEAIYDPGGVDTFDLGAHSRPSVVDLTPGAYSSIAYWSLAQQRDYWLAKFPGAADLILRSYNDPNAPEFTYEWRDNLGIAFGTVIENVRAGAGDDTITGNGVANQLSGNAGADRIFGAAGDDTIDGGSGANYLRGDDGDDRVTGGSAFDDANGNMGNDTITTGAGDDWAVGGKDNDSLSGEAGGDIVWGNLGNDTQDGGDGNDQVRGGQGDDTISGGAGDDFVSGDRGADTIAGGTGADLFHGSQDAGVDRAIDFNQAEGDRVFLDPGTISTLGQVGADTVIDMGGGHQMILVGVQMSTLTPGWIFGA